jgi:hypothetical protein
MKTGTKVVLIVAGAAILALCGGVGVAVMNVDSAPPPTRVLSASGSPHTLSPAAAESTAPVAASSKASPAAPKPVSIEQGTWTVGTDVPAGTYRSSGASAGCYWAITKTGTNGETIIANDLPSGGRPQVTLKVGQDFQTSEECGAWSKIR